MTVLRNFLIFILREISAWHRGIVVRLNYYYMFPTFLAIFSIQILKRCIYFTVIYVLTLEWKQACFLLKTLFCSQSINYKSYISEHGDYSIPHLCKKNKLLPQKNAYSLDQATAFLIYTWHSLFLLYIYVLHNFISWITSGTIIKLHGRCSTQSNMKTGFLQQ